MKHSREQLPHRKVPILLPRTECSSSCVSVSVPGMFRAIRQKRSCIVLYCTYCTVLYCTVKSIEGSSKKMLHTVLYCTVYCTCPKVSKTLLSESRGNGSELQNSTCEYPNRDCVLCVEVHPIQRSSSRRLSPALGR